MDSEKRQYPREHRSSGINLKFNGREIPCTLENISSAGAYISIANSGRENISKMNIGQEVEIEIPGYESEGTRKGVLLRIENSNNSTYIAVYFK